MPNNAPRSTSNRTVAHSRMTDWLLLLVCNLIWGSQFLFLKLVQRQMGPFFATIFPIALSIVVIIPIVRGRADGRGVAEERMSRSDFLGFVLLGVLGQAAVLLFSTWGVRLTLVSDAAVVALSFPVATAAMAYFLLAEKMTTIRAASFALAIGGVLECSGINWRALNFASPQFLLGNFMCFIAVLGSAFYNVYSKKLLTRYSALRIVLYSYYGALAVLLPIAMLKEPESFRSLLHFSLATWSGLLFLAVLRNVLALVILLDVLKRLDATVVGLSNYLIPFFGVLTAAIFLHEHLTEPMVAGGSLVLASTLLMTIYEERQLRRSRSAAEAVENPAHGTQSLE